MLNKYSLRWRIHCPGWLCEDETVLNKNAVIRSLSVVATSHHFLLHCIAWVANNVWTHSMLHATRLALSLGNGRVRERYGYLGRRSLSLSLSPASGCTFILHSPCNPRARATLIQPLTSHADRANHSNPILSPLAPGNTIHQQESPQVKLCYSYSPNK
jgi:hypothetical protein